MNALLVGELMHARHDSARRAFSYPVYMAMINLTAPPFGAAARERPLARDLTAPPFGAAARERPLARVLTAPPFGAAARERPLARDLEAPPTARLFSRDRWNVMSLHAADYDGGRDALYAANGVPVPARTVLITNPRVFGYTFNPVSFFLGYGAAGIESVIAEVNNTYGGRRRYLLGPQQRLPGPRVGFRHVRELFVSPFLPGELTYDFWFDDGDPVAIEMHVTDRAERRVFTARFTGARRPFTDRAIAATALRYPLMTAQVIALIHWQALKLRLAGVPYFRPGPDHAPRS